MAVGQQITDGIKLVGGLAGLIALGWKVLEEMKTYLRIKVEAKKDGNNYSVLTEIENANKISTKVIKNAFLLISPEEDNLIQAGQRIASVLEINQIVESTNDFEYLFSDVSVYVDNQIAFIPLAFYYSENLDIADEKLTYRCYIDRSQLAQGQYSVRFYIYGEKRLHRSTQDLMFIS